jgi:Sortase domain
VEKQEENLEVALDSQAVVPGDHPGALLIPAPRQVGWHEAGPGPGQPGSTLLAGDIDYDGVASRFVKLAAVPDGAAVIITTASGRLFTYRITCRRLPPKRSLASTSVLQSNGSPTLVLVSCGEAFLTARRVYADNTVIVASPAGGTSA